MNSFIVSKNITTALERGNNKSNQHMTLASFGIPVEGSKELDGLPSAQFLQLVVLSDKYGKNAANPKTQNFHVEQKIIFEWWLLQSLT